MPCSLRETLHYSFATDYFFFFFFSLRGFLTKLLAEWLIHWFSALMLFNFLKEDRGSV